VKKNLTHAVVSALKPPAEGQLDVWDKRKPGFGLRISKGGTKTWLLMYRQNGRKRRYKLGRFPDMSVADARADATARLGDVARGADPAKERAQDRSEPTFADLADLYMKHHSRPKKKPRSVVADERMLRADLLPIWQHRRLGTIGRRDVIALIDDIVARGAPVHANRTKALISSIFNFAIGRDLLEQNPAYKVPKPTLERSRDRFLSDGEIRRLWAALETEPLKVKAAYRLALLTAARRSELLDMPWTELDLDSGWWVLPADRTKAGKTHRIPLGPTALNLLRALQVDRDSPFVFSGRYGRPVVNPQKWNERLRKNAQLENFRLHDLRRTTASKLTEIGVPRLVVSKLLNHAEGGITAIYDRHSYDQEKREALIKWDRHLQRLLTGEADEQKVVQLHA
jgi:integrase